ncbi:MAG: hypothetical protein IJU52_02555 [Clostridia bacterium]|nr:hypothetical protein [Clostridia bacterium]
MKGTDLYNAFGEVDDRYISESAPAKEHITIKMPLGRAILIAAAAALALAAVLIPLGVMMSKKPEPVDPPVVTNSAKSKTEEQTAPTIDDPTKPTDDPVTPTDEPTTGDGDHLRIYAVAPEEIDPTEEHCKDEKKTGQRRTVVFLGVSYETEYAETFIDEDVYMNGADKYAVLENGFPSGYYFVLDEEDRILELQLALNIESIFPYPHSDQEFVNTVKTVFADEFDFSGYTGVIVDFHPESSTKKPKTLTFYCTYNGYTIDNTLSFEFSYDIKTLFRAVNRWNAQITEQTSLLPLIDSKDLEEAADAKIRNVLNGKGEYEYTILSKQITRRGKEVCILLNVEISIDKGEPEVWELRVTSDRAGEYALLQEKGKSLCGRFEYREQVLLGRIADGEEHLTAEMIDRILAGYGVDPPDDFVSVLNQFSSYQPFPDFVGGSGVTLLEFWKDDQRKEFILFIWEQKEIYAVKTNDDGSETSVKLY